MIITERKTKTDRQTVKQEGLVKRCGIIVTPEFTTCARGGHPVQVPSPKEPPPALPRDEPALPRAAPGPHRSSASAWPPSTSADVDLTNAGRSFRAADSDLTRGSAGRLLAGLDTHLRRWVVAAPAVLGGHRLPVVGWLVVCLDLCCWKGFSAIL